ncbi:MAG: flagellin lysine-N-methylase [Clostridia bacterium]|nr:flagellin lysine-N-methylase [Clostridia bacterium]
MKEIIPSYYPKFRCIADRCRHSCCIGWEIDIDEETLQNYDNPAVKLYDRFQKQIDREDAPHFRLDKDERCPFLTDTGLCEIILTMGEENLCQICADHPRFRNFFSDRTEVGLGLCCEAAAELILFQTEPVCWLTAEDDGEPDIPTPEETECLTLREQVYAVLQNRKAPISIRLAEMLTLCGGQIPEKPVGLWAESYRTLERLDPAWDDVLQRLSADTAPLTMPDADTPWDLQLENLAVYFAFRHLAGALDDDRLAARAAFCVLSILFLYTLFRKTEMQKGSLSPADMIELVRLYSSEIEYSEDNMECLFDELEALL